MNYKAKNRLQSMTSALLCIDLQNEYLHTEGKLGHRGYVEFAEKHNSIQRIARIQEHFREQGFPVMHTRLVFSDNYSEHPENSPLLGPIRGMEAFKDGEWGVEFHEMLKPKNGEIVINKHRMSAFHRTRLDLILRTQKIDHLYVLGVPTNISVETTVREAHDHDYKVSVIADGCIARNDDLHNNSMTSIEDFAEVKDHGDIMLKLVVSGG